MQAIEDERKKAQSRKEKEARELQREDKERQRELDRAQREKERALQHERREAKKEADRQLRERERVVKREQARREGKEAGGGKQAHASAEMRKARAEAAVQVLQSFDEEEEQEARDQMTLALLSARLDESLVDSSSSGRSSTDLKQDQISAVNMNMSLDSYLSTLPSFQDELSLGQEGDADIEQILDAFNCLYSLRGFLGISADLTFNKFIREILGNPLPHPSSESVEPVKQEQVQDEELEELDGQVSEETRHSSRLADSTLGSEQGQGQWSQDAAELDRIQLNLLHTLLPDLNARFALDDDEGGGSAPSATTSRKVSNALAYATS